LNAIPYQTSFQYQYRLWGHQIVSDCDLGDLRLVAEDSRPRGAIHLRLASERSWAQPKPEIEAFLSDRLEHGDLWLACWKFRNCYVAHFPKSCSFLIQPDQMCIEYAPEPDVAHSTIVHMVLDHAIPRLLSLKPGYLALHASAVQVGRQAIAFLGQNGQGKSTLAAWLATRGFPLLTDDCLVLHWDEVTRQWLAYPSYQSVRLWPDSVDALGVEKSTLREFAGYSAKKRTGEGTDFQFGSERVPLKAYFLLSPRASPEQRDKGTPSQPAKQPLLEIRPLIVQELLPALVQSVFRLDAEDKEINRREFQILTTLMREGYFWSLDFERKYDQLPDVQSAIINTLRAGSVLSRRMEKGDNL
jgi:hypothetical protein